jgi:ADP-heptose:LPS heptosyltransferase
VKCPHKILVLRLGAMGDVLFSTPALRALKSLYPESRITYVTLKQWSFLLKRNRNVDRVVGLRALYPNAARRLRAESFDLLVNLQELPVGAQICETIPALERRGNRWIDGGLVCDEQSRLLAKDPATQRELYEKNTTGAAIYCRVARVEPDSLNFDFTPGPVAEWRARRFLAGRRLDRPPAPIALHLHSRGHPAKGWSPQTALRLVRAMPDRRFLVLGYRKDRRQTQAFEREPNAAVSYAPAAVQAAMLRSCALFVGIDSGPRQLAAAMGTPCLTLFGPNPREFLPEAARDRALSVDCPRAPCFDLRCPRGMECLDQIAPERIRDTILDMLKR